MTNQQIQKVFGTSFNERIRAMKTRPDFVPSKDRGTRKDIRNIDHIIVNERKSFDIRY